MNRPLDIASALQLVEVASEADFRIGLLRIYPSQRQIMFDHRRKTLQPRAMQVLVALAKAGGAVVSRERLIERCWDGVVVGDDAINSSINKVRQVSEFGGIRHFEVETISRVGYRLHVPATSGEQIPFAPEAAPEPTDIEDDALPVAPSSWVRKSKIAVIGAAMAVACIAAVLLARGWSPASKEIGIAVNTTGAPMQGSLGAELDNLAGARGGLAFGDGLGSGPGDFVLNVPVQRIGTRLQADAALTKRGSKNLLWSSSVTASDPALLRQRVAYAALEMVDCAMDASPDIRKLDRSGLRLIFSACNRSDDPDDELKIELWRKAVEADPGNPQALAMLGFAEANSVGPYEPDNPPVIARRRLARSHLQTALATDASIGSAYAAQEALLPRWHYRERRELLNQVIARDPDSALLLDGKAQFLRDIGKVEVAIDALRRAAALAPASPVIRSDLISALAYGGYAATAATDLKDAERIWPDSFAIRDARARFDLRFGDPKELMRAMDSGTAIPNFPTSWQSVALQTLRARAEPTPANISAAIDTAERLAPDNEPQGWLQTLVILGAIDKAYAHLENPRAIDQFRHGPTEVLFRSYMRRFVLDRRFPNLAAKLGLLQFWESSGQWPNICDDSQLPYNCQQEAQRLHAPLPLHGHQGRK